MEGLKTSSSRLKKAGIRLGFSIVALTIVFLIVEPSAVFDALRSVSLGPWLMTLLGFVVLHLLSASKWRFVMQTCGLSISNHSVYSAYGMGLFANLCLPSLVGGDVVRAGIIMREVPKKEAVVFAGLVDRLLDVTALALLVAVGFFLAPSALGQIDADISLQKNLIYAGLATTVLGAIVAPIIMRRLHPRRMPIKVGKVWLGFIRAFRQLLKKPGHSLFAFVFCFLLQAGFVTVNLLLGQAMGLDLDPRLWFLLWPLAKIAAMAPVSLGGIGVREAAFVGLAGTFAAKDLILAQSLVWESTLIAGGLLFGLTSVMMRRSE